MKLRRCLFGLFLVILLAGCTAPAAVPQTGVETTEIMITTMTPSATVADMGGQPVANVTPAPVVMNCAPTGTDMLGPFYTPGAPQRTAVGQGYILTGVVRSAADCRPVSSALVEFWMAGPDGNYTDTYRASQVVGTDGIYRFESHVPPPYSGRPSHIHIKVSAPGFNELVTQHYPEAGNSQASFDLVLQP